MREAQTQPISEFPFRRRNLKLARNNNEQQPSIHTSSSNRMNTDITASEKPQYPVIDRNPPFTAVVGNFNTLDYLRFSSITGVSVVVGYLSGIIPLHLHYLSHRVWIFNFINIDAGIKPGLKGPSMVTGGLIGLMGGFMYAYQNSAGRLMGFFPNEGENYQADVDLFRSFVHAYYDAVLHSCRLVVLRLYAMVDRDSFQTAKTHFTRSVDILTKCVRRINVTETQDWRFGLVGVGCLITVGEPVLEQSEAAALFQTENEEIDRWRLVFSSCFGLGFKGKEASTSSIVIMTSSSHQQQHPAFEAAFLVFILWRKGRDRET
ncbi:NADH-u ox-rdase domain-containing protein [Citrus sinensis]|nr:NADH-u ox-rdase domain-containing protein [Citrus sinensis]